MREPDHVYSDGAVRFGQVFVQAHSRLPFSFGVGFSQVDKAGALRRRDDLRKRLKDVEDAIEWYERREKE